VHGQRLVCIRAKALEIYENDGRLTAAFHSSHIVDAIIADFSKSGRYVLLLETDKWRYSIFDLHQQSFSFIPPFKFAANENPQGLKMPKYMEGYTILTHAFSHNERYICFPADDLNHSSPGVVAVWDRQSEEFLLTQIWSGTADCRPSHVQFDTSRPETLHMLIRASNHSMTGGTRGFIQIDLSDKSTFDCFHESNKTRAFSRYDICVNHRGGWVFRKVFYDLRTASDAREFIDVISWNLDKSPPEVDCRFTLPLRSEGWKDGYAQSNGIYDDWCMFSKACWIISPYLYYSDACRTQQW
jgi:hypothetical protein